MKSCRLIYKSTAIAEVVSNATLSDLERTASELNARQDITGLLVLSGRTFLQVLEGGAQDVTALFGRILADKRHQGVELVAFESSVERLFDDWNMRLVDLYDLPGDKRAFLASKYDSEQGEILIPDDVRRVYAFLFDAKSLCLSTPWVQPDEPDSAAGRQGKAK